MTTQTTPARLGLVPSAAHIEAQLEAVSGYCLDTVEEREKVAAHLAGNLFPNADAPTLAEVLNAMKGVADSTDSIQDGYALVSREAWNELQRVRSKLLTLAPVVRAEVGA